jgi:hypothetical protein
VAENGAAVNAFDGKVNTKWITKYYGSSPGYPHEVQINLGLAYDLVGFRYLPRQDHINGRIARYEFYVSMDGSNWGAAVTAGIFANTPAEKEVYFASKRGQFIRLKALSEVNGNPWASMAEINVIADLPRTNQAPDSNIDAPSADVSIVAGQSISFSGSGIDPDSNLPLTYRWQFGSSGIPDLAVEDPGPVVFNLPGTYAVTFTVTDALGLPDPTPATRVVIVTGNLSVISHTGWTLKYVDSQETVAEDGAALNGFDGNVNTKWITKYYGSSPGYPHEVQINLGLAYDLAGFRYLPRQDHINGRIARYEFYVSMDGSNWGTAVAAGTFANTPAEKEVCFASKRGQFIRLKALSEVNGNPWTSMAEINVLGNR